MVMENNARSLEAVKSLDGKIFSTLSQDEKALLDFFRDQGRKYGVSIWIINEANAEELSQARSRQQADQILRQANSRIKVFVAEPQ